MPKHESWDEEYIPGIPIFPLGRFPYDKDFTYNSGITKLRQLPFTSIRSRDYIIYTNFKTFDVDIVSLLVFFYNCNINILTFWHDKCRGFESWSDNQDSFLISQKWMLFLGVSTAVYVFWLTIYGCCIFMNLN